MNKIYMIKEPTGKIKNADDLFKKIKTFDIDYSQENFIVFFLDARLKVIDSEIMFKGGLDECVVDPKTFFRKALLSNASAVIISHNHPSGNLNPSDADYQIYEALRKAGELLNINVVDSVIFNKNEFYRMERAF